MDCFYFLCLFRWCMHGGVRVGSIWKRETTRSSAPAVGVSRKSTEKPYCPNCGAKMDIKDGGGNDAAD